MKQGELLKKGMDSKEAENVLLDKRHHADLNILKEKGGPFTKSDEVDIFLARVDITDADKIKHLYFEISYAQDTSLSIPKTSDIYKLKKDYKNLPLMTYARNLKTYLSNATLVTSVTVNDFDHALSSVFFCVKYVRNISSVTSTVHIPCQYF